MQALTFFFAFVAVLALIGLAAWLVRQFAGNRLGANTNRGRMPRLAVIDAAAVDGRSRLVLVRRDNIEHLLMIGGPTDIVVESEYRARGRRPGTIAVPPGRGGSGTAAADRPAAGCDWATKTRVGCLPSCRTANAGAAAARRRVPPSPKRCAARPRRRMPQRTLARPERRADPLAGFAAEPMARPTRMEPRPEPRPEPPRLEPRPEPRAETRAEPLPQRLPRSEPLMPRPARQMEMPKAPPLRERAAAPPPPPPPPPAPPAGPNADQNLAEMAQRLEAALRRPAGRRPWPRRLRPSRRPRHGRCAPSRRRRRLPQPR